ncbi:MAG: cyclic nucleotide-binding protein [Nitrospinae bacterium CG11_big_fil_rev_8_21_14_0_20_56_8]|nr:MAG: cyclic nucleotide-binding protein [Nitrospinae bacterium CG11_big_fil_rev_8_21_14_0_20_56_8]
MKNKEEVLRRAHLFASLSDPDLQTLAEIVVPKSYRKNQVLIRQGEPGNILFLLTSGSVKISLLGSSGREIILKFLYAHDIFGEMSLLDGKYRSATVTTLEPSRALIIYRDDFVRLIRKNPDFAMNMLADLNRRLRQATDQIASLTFFDAYGRVAQVLLNLSEKQGRREGAWIRLTLNCSRQEMAALAGLSRETFTRVLHEFQARGYLNVKGKTIMIADEALLKREIL